MNKFFSPVTQRPILLQVRRWTKGRREGAAVEEGEPLPHQREEEPAASELEEPPVGPEVPLPVVEEGRGEPPGLVVEVILECRYKMYY